MAKPTDGNMYSSPSRDIPRPDPDALYLYRCVHCVSVTVLPLDHAQANCRCGAEFHPSFRGPLELGAPIPVSKLGGEAFALVVDGDGLHDLLRACRRHLREHDGADEHLTPTSLYELLDEVLK